MPKCILMGIVDVEVRLNVVQGRIVSNVFKVVKSKCAALFETVLFEPLEKLVKSFL